jgi:hypothetical protein
MYVNLSLNCVCLAAPYALACRLISSASQLRTATQPSRRRQPLCSACCLAIALMVVHVCQSLSQLCLPHGTLRASLPAHLFGKPTAHGYPALSQAVNLSAPPAALLSWLYMCVNLSVNCVCLTAPYALACRLISSASQLRTATQPSRRRQPLCSACISNLGCLTSFNRGRLTACFFFW